jgi:hypothetical protein
MAPRPLERSTTNGRSGGLMRQPRLEGTAPGRELERPNAMPVGLLLPGLPLGIGGTTCARARGGGSPYRRFCLTAKFHDVAPDDPCDATLMRLARPRSGQINSKQQRGYLWSGCSPRCRRWRNPRQDGYPEWGGVHAGWRALDDTGVSCALSGMITSRGGGAYSTRPGRSGWSLGWTP